MASKPNLNTSLFNRYFVALDISQTWTEVHEETFKEYEVQAGFYPKVRGRTATGGFSSRGVMGKIVAPGQELPEKFEPEALTEPETFKVKLSYVLPGSLRNGPNDIGERSYETVTNQDGMIRIMALMDEVSE